jgi:hypothetical protein
MGNQSPQAEAELWIELLSFVAAGIIEIDHK